MIGPTGKFYNASLDGIRALAIIMVLFFHTQYSDSETLLSGGFIGVELFFVLSGYLITKLLLMEHGKAGTINIKNFYMRRAFRLFPALWLMLFCALVYVIVLPSNVYSAQVSDGIIATLLYYSNWSTIYLDNRFYFLNHTWSLAIEEQFYVTWPWFLLLSLKFIQPRGLIKVVALLIIVSAMLQAYFYYKTDYFLRSYAGTDTRASGILIGCILALMLQSKYDIIFLHKKLVVMICGWLALPLLVVISMVAKYDSGWMYYGLGTLVSLSSAGLIAAVEINRGSSLSGFLALPPIQFIGKISYGLYLWHFPVFVLFHERQLNIGVIDSNLASWFTTFIVAIVSYFLIERKFLKYKSNYT